MSYVPGSEVRAGAMLNDTIDATIVDAAAFRLLQEEGGGRFERLPVEGVDATDEALYTSTSLLEERQDDLVVFVEELLRTWRDIADDPSIVAELREQYDLLPDLPEEAAADITPYYTNAVENDVYPLDGGSPEDVRADLEFLAAAGQVETPGDDFDASTYWDFGPLREARENLGIE
jgi:NitT/TauT family transport system substrate-binding protein